MKSLYKGIFGLALAGMLISAVSFTASAQRGHIGIRGGIHLGFGGPRFGFGLGYYRPYYAYPHVGFYINTLPYGYYPFYYGPDLYYYWGGTFYRPSDKGYAIAAPPIGATIPKLPANAHPIMIDGQQYDELNGVYYKESVDDKGKKTYIVSGKDGVLNTGAAITPPDQYVPRVGDVVTQLPDGCRSVTLNGTKYYISADDIYYEAFKDANDNTSYRIASVPDDEAPAAPQQQPDVKPDDK